MTQHTTRSLSYGAVSGADGINRSYAWLGIPYAAAPIGELRWRAPRAPIPWHGVRQAVKSACPCTQLGFEGPKGSEDCLFLNVWTPALKAEDIKKGPRLPVMVWFHGGGNVMGDSALFDGGVLAAKGNVVVITANYRLGVFGWFSHRSLRESGGSPDDGSGNYGTLDQIAVLKWVRDNVGAFGGDTDNVTIFGQSAGGANVLALLTSPLAQGLFHRAIAQSPYVDSTPVAVAENLADEAIPGTARSSSEVFARLLVCEGRAKDRADAVGIMRTLGAEESAAYLRSKSYADFARAYLELPSDTDLILSAGGIPQAVNDGVVLPRDGIWAALARGEFHQVPVILGLNRDEMRIMLALEGAAPFVHRDMKTGATTVPDKEIFYAAADYATQLWKVSQIDRAATLISARNPGKVFVYQFGWNKLAPAPMWDNILLGAAHGLDVAFVLGHLQLGPEYLHIPLIRPESLDSYRELSDQMMSYWAQFAVAGNPGRGKKQEQPEWAAWDAENGLTLLLNASDEGGIRLARLRTSRGEILGRLRTDATFNSTTARYQFLQGLLPIKIAGLGKSDYEALDVQA